MFLRMGINPKVCFLGGMGGRSLVVSQNRKAGLKKFPRIFFFWVWDGVIGERGWVYFFLVYIIFVIW